MGKRWRTGPDRGWTWQIGDGARAGRDDAGHRGGGGFSRARTWAAGGQGAPLLPVYHRALCAGLPKPVAVLNLGGVGNVTWIGEGEDDGAGDTLVAFDTGPSEQR